MWWGWNFPTALVWLTCLATSVSSMLYVEGLPSAVQLTHTGTVGLKYVCSMCSAETTHVEFRYRYIISPSQTY
jgi:hypothetical protein